ncbi:MAG: hypothetical protein SH847_03255 [Roseiflexaceae bacterium]|nr:hypothetical protein [Roseiflexaceae bacterium]
MLVLARLVGFSSRRATGDEKHDGSAISTLNVLWVLYDQVLRYNPHNPKWEGRDRFLLSKGHGPLALYAILATKGYTIWM